jgi:hypothetical protein
MARGWLAGAGLGTAETLSTAGKERLVAVGRAVGVALAAGPVVGVALGEGVLVGVKVEDTGRGVGENVKEGETLNEGEAVGESVEVFEAVKVGVAVGSITVMVPTMPVQPVQTVVPQVEWPVMGQ